MNINELTKEYIDKRRETSHAFHRFKDEISNNKSEAWMQGWNAGVHFARRVENAVAICDQCGKLIMNQSNVKYMGDDFIACPICYEKLTKQSTAQ